MNYYHGSSQLKVSKKDHSKLYNSMKAMKHFLYEPKTDKPMKTTNQVIEKPVYQVDKKLKSHANDPFVKKKVAKAVEILSKLEKQDKASVASELFVLNFMIQPPFLL